MYEELIERRIGAYGGTFDPIHSGHVEVACAIVSNFQLDKLLIIPSARPPHKSERSVSDSYHRYSMSVLATIDIPNVTVSTIEIEAPDRPYTFETVERLKSIFGSGSTLFFVMGSDSFGEIRTWKEPQRILANSNVIVASRPGYKISSESFGLFEGESDRSHERGRAGEAPAVRIVDLRTTVRRPVDRAEVSKGRTIYLTDYVRSSASSTEIRRRVRAGLPIDGLTPAAVISYIEKYELYQAEEAWLTPTRQ